MKCGTGQALHHVAASHHARQACRRAAARPRPSAAHRRAARRRPWRAGRRAARRGAAGRAPGRWRGRRSRPRRPPPNPAARHSPDGQRMPGAEAVPGQGHDADPHPERLADREAAGIGEGIEGDVDPAIGGEQRLVRHAGFQRHAIRRQPVRGEAGLHAVARRRLAQRMGAEDEAAVRHGRQDAGPGAQHRRRHLGQVVEAAEGDMATRQRRQRRHRGAAGRSRHSRPAAAAGAQHRSARSPAASPNGRSASSRARRGPCCRSACRPT